jgi:RNA polymerase sigma-70 factor (ECF subfamily)
VIAIQPESDSSETLPTYLVEAAQRGDREAFGLLVERYERTVYAVALRRLGNHAEAQELVQEVFIQAMRKIDQLRQPEAFAGWLRSITVRLSINRAVRQRGPLAIESEALDAQCVESTTPLTEALRSERREQVHSALSELGELDRETLEAFYLRGQSLIEMSEEFEAPIGTIKRRLHVARKRFAAVLDEEMSEELVAV